MFISRIRKVEAVPRAKNQKSRYGPARKDNTMNNTNSGRTFTVCTTNKINNNNYTTHHWSWEEVLSRVAHSIKTNETSAEYAAMNGKERTAVKDVGGFVAGELADGKRSNATLITRSMVTLDADTASADFWDNYKKACPSVAACAYSTHSSTPEKLRLRLVIPLSRDVTPQEYEYIARSIAEAVGMGNFDSSTFEPARHMFFPSCSCDATPYFRKNTGDFFDVDSLMEKYPDWEDKSTWPHHPDESKKVYPQQVTMDDAVAVSQTAPVCLPAHTVSESSAPNPLCPVDPRAKNNIVGLFCAAYSVPEAIRTFLSRSYEPTTTRNRFSYVHASSYGGLLVSDDESHAYIDAHPMEGLTLARKKGWVCPLCGNGSGDDGDGLVLGKEGNIRCFVCGFSGDRIDLEAERANISDHHSREAFEAA